MVTVNFSYGDFWNGGYYVAAEDMLTVELWDTTDSVLLASKTVQNSAAYQTLTSDSLSNTTPATVGNTLEVRFTGLVGTGPAAPGQAAAIDNVSVSTAAAPVVLTAPTITAPTDEEYFTGTPITNSWTAVDGAVKYQVWYVYDDGHTFSGGPETCPDVAEGGCRETTDTFRNHSPSTSEYGGLTIRVRAVDASGNLGPWSDPVHYYYVDKISSTIVVNKNTSTGENIPGWLFNRDISTSNPYEFVAGTPSIGSGSLYVEPIGATASNKFVGEYFFDTTTTKMGDIETISYDFQIGSGGVPADANEFYINVYANFAGSSPTKYYDCRYTLVPSVGAVGSYTTVTFDTSVAQSVFQHASSPSTCPATPADMGAGAVIRAFALNLGDTSANDVGVDGNFDNVVITTTNAVTTYDFEELVRDVVSQTLVVTPVTLHSWIPSGTGGGSYDFITSAGAPMGAGSVQLMSDNTNTARASVTLAQDFPFADLDNLSYKARQNSTSIPEGNASYRISFDADGNLATTGDTASLIYEPYWQNAGSPDPAPVVAATWQTWDVDAGLFWASIPGANQPNLPAITNGAGGPPFYTLAQIKALYPNAKVTAISVGIGSYNREYDIEIDEVVIGTKNDTEIRTMTYDFDPIPPVTPGADATYVITQSTTATENNAKKWFFNRDTATDTPYEFNADQAVLGTGSLFVEPIGSTPADKFIGEYFVLKNVYDVGAISFDYRLADGVDPSKVNHIYLNVYANFDNSNDFGHCVYTVSATDGTPGWHTLSFDPTASGYNVRTRASAPTTCPAVLTDLPVGAQIRAIALNVGDTSANDEGVSAYLDNVIVKTNEETSIYDFEPDTGAPAVPTGLAWTDSNGDDVPHEGTTHLYAGTASWDANTEADFDHYIYKYWNDIATSPYNDEATAWTSNKPGIGNTSSSGAFNQGEGTHYFCIAAVDTAGNESACSEVFTITYDVTAPVLATVTPVPTPDVDTTPTYVFSSTEAGTITYGGSCASVTTVAIAGDNTVTFNTLPVGTYADCTIIVTDGAGNVSDVHAVPQFVISTNTIVSGGGGGGGGSVDDIVPSTGGGSTTPTDTTTPTDDSTTTPTDTTPSTGDDNTPEEVASDEGQEGEVPEEVLADEGQEGGSGVANENDDLLYPEIVPLQLFQTGAHNTLMITLLALMLISAGAVLSLRKN